MKTKDLAKRLDKVEEGVEDDHPYILRHKGRAVREDEVHHTVEFLHTSNPENSV